MPGNIKGHRPRTNRFKQQVSTSFLPLAAKGRRRGLGCKRLGTPIREDGTGLTLAKGINAGDTLVGLAVLSTT